jgi:AraC-like DNA-binding protein
MRATLRPLVLLHADSTFSERVQRAAYGRFDVRVAADWTELRRAVRTTVPSGVAVVDPYFGRAGDQGVAQELERLLEAHPAATVVVALKPRPGWPLHLRALGSQGAAGALLVGEHDSEVFLVHLLAQVRSRALRVLVESYETLVPGGRARTILDAAADAVVRGNGAGELATEMGLHRDTLLRWCHAAGLPVPRRLLLWMRMLLAAELLENPGQRVSDVAAACGYASDAALARALVDHLGMRPDALRRAGALHTVSELFHRELRESGAAPR